MDEMTKIRFCDLYSCVIIAEGANLTKVKHFTKEGLIDYEF